MLSNTVAVVKPAFLVERNNKLIAIAISVAGSNQLKAMCHEPIIGALLKLSATSFCVKSLVVPVYRNRNIIMAVMIIAVTWLFIDGMFS